MTPYRAEKIGGSYQAKGLVVAEFDVEDGRGQIVRRCVFRFDEPAGMLHIFNPEQLTKSDERENV